MRGRKKKPIFPRRRELTLLTWRCFVAKAPEGYYYARSVTKSSGNQAPVVIEWSLKELFVALRKRRNGIAKTRARIGAQTWNNLKEETRAARIADLNNGRVTRMARAALKTAGLTETEANMALAIKIINNGASSQGAAVQLAKRVPRI